MKRTRKLAPLAVVLLAGLVALARADEGKEAVKEKAFDAPHKVKVKVRMEGPYTADVPLQVVCYFKYTPEGARKMSGAPVELDKRLGGVIASLRERGEFVGDSLETLLILPPKDSIEAKKLLLVGLGDEKALSLELMEAVGRVSLREAARLGVNRVAFAPLIRDQGNSKFGTGDVAKAVVRGMLRAYDTEKRLQKEGLSKEYTLVQWSNEAGEKYFEDTTAGVQEAIKEAAVPSQERGIQPTDRGLSANKKVVLRWYEAVRKFDYAALPTLVDPELQWNLPEQFVAEARPRGSQYNGGKFITEEYLPKYLKQYAKYDMEPTRMVEEGDTVVAFGRYKAKFKGGDKEFQSPFAHLWRIRDGKIYFHIVVMDSAPFNDALKRVKK